MPSVTILLGSIDMLQRGLLGVLGGVAFVAISFFGTTASAQFVPPGCDPVNDPTCYEDVGDYFRPWLSSATDSNLSNDWTDPPDDSTLDPKQIVYVADWGADTLPNGSPNPETSEAAPLRHIATAWMRLNDPIRPAGVPGNPRCCNQNPMGARLRLWRGSVFDGEVLTPPPSTGPSWGGKGASLPLVIEAWPRANMTGGDANRPVIKIPVKSLGEGTAPCWDMRGGSANSFQAEWGGDIWVIGLEITSQSIPSGIGAGWVPVKPASAFMKKGSTGARFLFEDLYIHNVGTAFEIDGNDSNHLTRTIRGLTIRRCVLMDFWQRNLNWGEGDPEGSTSGGAYFGSVKWGLIEDNFWHKCGWNHLNNHPVVMSTDLRTPPVPVVNPLAPKNVFSQGMYMPASSQHMLVRNNIMSRPPHAGIQSRGRNQRIVNNLVLSAPMGISLGHAQNQGKWNPNPALSELSEPPIPEKYWRGECKYNVVINGANVDKWNDVPVSRVVNGQTVNGRQLNSVDLDGDARGYGITLTRCRRFDGETGNGASFDYYENTGGPSGTANELVKAAHVYRNLVALNVDGAIGGTAGLYINDDQEPKPNPAYIATYSALVEQNVFYNWFGGGTTGGYCINIDNQKALQPQSPTQVPYYGPVAKAPLGPNFIFTGNSFFQNAMKNIGRARFNPVGPTTGPSTWQGNQYYALMSLNPPHLGFRTQKGDPNPQPEDIDEPAAFANFQYPQTPPNQYVQPGWRTVTRETTTSFVPFINVPEAGEPTLATYMQDVLNVPPPATGVQNDVVDAYMNLCRSQRRGLWNSALEARFVNSYMRVGFGIPE